MRFDPVAARRRDVANRRMLRVVVGSPSCVCSVDAHQAPNTQLKPICIFFKIKNLTTYGFYFFSVSKYPTHLCPQASKHAFPVDVV